MSENRQLVQQESRELIETGQLAETERRNLEVAIQPDAPLGQLCQLLVECEKEQHRYHWTSGFLLLTLIKSSESPEHPAEFVEWLAKQTGMILTQQEVHRRITVYKFYSQFTDTRVIDLIQNGGSQIAYRARRVIDPKNPNHAYNVLKACIDNPGSIDDVLRKFGDNRKPRQSLRLNIRKGAISEMRQNITMSVQEMSGQKWVPLTVVIDQLDMLEKS